MANTPTVPLKATGVFTDTGSITLTGNGNSGTGTLKVSKGDLKVSHYSATRMALSRSAKVPARSHR